MAEVSPPAKRPCGSCPYRCDTPSGVWSVAEYEKLPLYDNMNDYRSFNVFLCHQQGGRLCAGWTAVHDMANSIGLRLAASAGLVDPGDLDEIIDYATDVELYESGQAAYEAGIRDIETPSAEAVKKASKLATKPGVTLG